MRGNTSVSLREIDKNHSKRKKGGYRFIVDVRSEGRRISQKYFKFGQAEQAHRYLEETQADMDALASRDRSQLTPEAMEQAIRAIKMLNKWDANIDDAVAFYVKHREAEKGKSDTSISKVVGALRDTKENEGCSVKYLKDLRTRLNVFEKAFDNRPLSSLTTAELQAWINERGSVTTQANYRRILNVLFNYAKRRKVITDNPIDDVDRVKSKTNKGFLSVEETEALLHHCSDEILPAVAIMLFAGIRPDYEEGEISRLDWKNIQFRKSNIHLDSEITKTASTRNVKMTDNLRAWLEPHRQMSGKVVQNPRKFRDLWEKARQDAGLFKGWISDATRKSFATYHVELTGNEYETMTQTGHTSVKTLRDHYKGKLEDPEEAQAYFSIVPSVKENVISINKTA